MHLYNKKNIFILLIFIFCFFPSLLSMASYSDYIWSSTNYLSVPTSSNISVEYTDDASNPLHLECESAILIEQTTRANFILL